MNGLRFAGYAALFDRVDRGGDIIRKGAFRETLEHRSRWPLLWQHRQDRIIGTIVHSAEDRRGLRVIATIDQDHEPAQQASALLVSGSTTGLSFGYRVRRFAERAGHSGARRELLALDLVEVSLVTHPMMPGACAHLCMRTH